MKPVDTNCEKNKSIFLRHLPLVGEEGLKRLCGSKVLVAGAGGLGSIVLEILVRTGVGELIVVDHGIVDEPDLNRQILYTKEDLGMNKVESAVSRLKKIRDVKVEGYFAHIDEKFSIPSDVDVIVDCLDNFKGKFILSDLAFKYRKPLVHGGINGFYGQVTTIIPGETLSLREMLKGVRESESQRLPVIAPSPLIIGTLEANEVIKYLTGVGTLLKNKILVVDLIYNDFQIIEIVNSQSQG